MKKKAVFIINLISGTSDKAAIPGLIDQYLDKTQFEYEIAVTQYAGHASEIAAKAKDDGVDVVVAIGGDGTVNEVARAIVHSSTALGIIPCGSGNGLARHLLLPLNVRKAIEVINRCEIRQLDYGIINEYPFFCTCGMGFDAFVSMKFAEAGKRGPITYVENVLREGLKYEPETYTIEDDNGTLQYKAFLISCANASQYGNNAYIAPQASMSDGRNHNGAVRRVRSATDKHRNVQQDARQELKNKDIPYTPPAHTSRQAGRNSLRRRPRNDWCRHRRRT